MAMQYRGYGTDDISVLDFIASHCPDNPNVPAFLQDIFHGAENRFESPGEGRFFVDDPDFAVYVVPCLKAAKSDIDRFLDARATLTMIIYMNIWAPGTYVRRIMPVPSRFFRRCRRITSWH